MNSHFSQQDRQGRLSTTLGPDSLVLLRLDGAEELSGDFEWRIEALSAEGGLDLEALLGSHATVEIDHAQGTRAFDGIVCEAAHRGAFENGWRYDLVLRPWLHVAGLRRNMRIFHDKTVIQIVEEVLGAYAGLGSPHMDVRVTEDYPVLEYTVQYGESDADFVRRQLERHGITWSWRHVVGSHTLLLTDAEFSLPAVPGASRPFYGVDGYHNAKEEHFRLWSSAKRITTGAVRLTEYNFKTPNAAQEVNQSGDAQHASGNVESYDWPGDYLDQGEGRGVVRRRLDAERGQAPRHRAAGDVVSLGAGWRVTLAGDEVPDATGRTFVCLKAEHRFRAQAYGSGDSGNDETPYEGAYVLTPDDTPFRPERRTVGPRVQGPETAVVVGEGEIDCDEHGRILVRFHWDLEAAHTMRVRVSQNWASKGWGGMVIPRIGMEVIVEHLRGDPDKPIVTGCVYNGKNRPPYDLPAHKTRSTFKTDTHQGTGFNELRFEDEKGREEIYIHAQKDRNEKTLHNYTVRTDNNKFESIGHMRACEVGHNSADHVRGNYLLAIGPNVKKPMSTKSERTNWQGMSHTGYRLGEWKDLPRGGGSMRIETELDTTIDAGRNLTVEADREMYLRSSGSTEHHIGGNLRFTVGTGSVESIGGRKVIRSREGIELSSGKSRLVLLPNGDIRLYGENITLSAKSSFRAFGGSVLVKAKQVFDAIAGKINLN